VGPLNIDPKNLINGYKELIDQIFINSEFEKICKDFNFTEETITQVKNYFEMPLLIRNIYDKTLEK